MEERYHATTQNRFYPDMSNVNKTITVEAKLISPPTYFLLCRQGLYIMSSRVPKTRQRVKTANVIQYLYRYFLVCCIIN